jgi:secreted trypsin-like serine protease
MEALVNTLVRRSLTALLTLAALTTVSAPAQAINYGADDDGAHPYVVLVAMFDADDEYIGRCSGSLLAADVVLTAAHCTDGAEYARIFLEENLEGVAFATSDLYDATGEPHAMPGWTGALTTPDTHDLGIYTLDTELVVERYATVAPLRTLDELATKRGTRDTYFTTVGYGLQQRKPYLVNQPKRMYAVSDLINLRSNLVDGVGLQTTNNPGDGRGGNCSGDSGGPILWQDSDVIVAVNSFGLNNTCKGNDFAYRVDTEAAQAFILPFLA